ncbi:MAG: FtsH protease activity modulator HflK [Mariprofundaceae bacterium]|nr:FtsH protease activity modulator HflK [Mariprofundaceae bacterium]
MPWNNQNQNPWGKKNPDESPPEMDDVIKRLKERFQNQFGSGGGSNNKNGSGGVPNVLVLLLIAVIFLGWLSSGFYKVAPDEEAVVLRLGKYNETTSPGLHWHLPYPLAVVEKLPVTQVQRLEIGFRSMGEGRSRDILKESLMLTKDENIVDISFVVQYKVKKIKDALFNIDNPVKTVRDASESAMREIIGRTIIDDVLTTKKAEVEIEVAALISGILDDYYSGLTVTTVKLQDVQPPERVIQEFKDVASAREDRERAKNEAQTHANKVIPNARGEAKKMVLDAEAYGNERIDHAKGESKRFASMLEAYNLSPEVTRKRLYLETMEEVMRNSDKVIIGNETANHMVPYLPLTPKTGQVAK